MVRPLLLISIFFLFVTACSYRAEIDDFDGDAWKADLKGCNGQRSMLSAGLEDKSDDLIGLSQNQVKSVLGNPDQHELYKRNQKFFIYYIDCPADEGLPSSYLQIRFNALGKSNEVTFIDSNS